MRIIVCGGRDYHNRKVVFDALDRLHRLHGVDFLIEGGHRNGADWLARQWRSQRGVSGDTYPADWNRYGRAAGPIRNRSMAENGDADGCVAFPGGSGTADMVLQADV